MKKAVYALIKDNIPNGIAINSAMHGIAAAYEEWYGDNEFDNWRHNSFSKRTCSVNDAEYNNAIKILDANNVKYKIITESSMDNAVILIITYPIDSRNDKFKAFRFFRLWK